MTNEKDNKSLEYLYLELVRINDELFEINKLRINKANNLITFNSALIAVLIIAPIQILIMSEETKDVILILFVPTIIFCISTYYSLKIYKHRNYITINAKSLFDNYWNASEKELLSSLSASLADDINLNFYTYDENPNFKEYATFLNTSLTYFQIGIITLIIASFIIVISYLWNCDIFIYKIFESMTHYIFH